MALRTTTLALCLLAACATPASQVARSRGPASAKARIPVQTDPGSMFQLSGDATLYSDGVAVLQADPTVPTGANDGFSCRFRAVSIGLDGRPITTTIVGKSADQEVPGVSALTSFSGTCLNANDPRVQSGQ